MRTHAAPATAAPRQPAAAATARAEAIGHGATHRDAPIQRLVAPPDVGQSPRMLAQRSAMQAVLGSAAQRQLAGPGVEEAPISASLDPQPVQRVASPPAPITPAAPPVTPAASSNQTGMPDRLKSGIESLSGVDMSAVRVHRNSDKPAQLSASAYAQGNDIHLGPGQEQHLPHEAWHVVQQRQGRVRQTMQMAGVGVNDDAGLEAEADVMGARAASLRAGPPATQLTTTAPSSTAQLDLISELTQQTLGSFLTANSLSALLGFADRKALDALSSYSSFKKVYDTAVSFSNALSLAITIWDSIPAPIRTGILFLTGKLMSAIPWVDALSYTEDFIVDADKDVKSTYLVYALDRLKLVLKAVSSPVSSAVDFGKYLYSSWWSGGSSSDPVTGETQAVKPSDRRGELAKLNLKIIWLDVKALHLEKGQRDDEDQPTQEGGLHADFAFGVNVFDKAWSIGETQDLTLILPWSGGAILRSSGPVAIINEFAFHDLFEISRLDMTMLEVSNEGLQQLAFSLGKLGIANDALTMSGATASYAKGAGMNFAGNMGLSIYGWDAKATLGLALDSDGKFVEGTAENFSESSGALKVDSVKLSKSEGFAIRNAELNLKPSTGLDLKATLAELNIKQSSVTGSASIRAADIPLFGEKVKLTEAGGDVAYRSRTDWGVSAYAALAMDFSHVRASGRFSISHESSTGVTDLQLKNGQFRADYDGVSVTATGMAYEHSKRTFTLANAEVDIKAIDTKAAVKGVTVNQTGLNFEEATIAHKEPIRPFGGLTIDDALLKLEKSEEELKVTASANLAVDIGTPKVQGRAKGVRLAFDNRGLRGEVDAFSLQTAPFNLDIESASLSKEQLSVAKAKISFNGGGDTSSDREATQMIPSLKQGLLDFIPIGPIAFEAKQIVVNGSGFSVGSFKPLIPPINFKAFGVSGGLDFENLKASLGASYDLSLAKMTGLPLKAEVFYPVFPGLEVYGSLAADASLGLAFGAEAGAQTDHWALSGQVKVNAGVSLTAGLGAQIGSQALVALSAGIFAMGEAKITNAVATVSGRTRYDRAAKKFVTVEPLHVTYDFGAAAIVSIGGEIKAKALYFYEYTIYRYTAAQWTLGEYKLTGKLGDASGELDPQRADKLGLADNKAAPAPTAALDKQAADAKLRSDVPIGNSAQARLELLKTEAAEASLQLRELHESGRREREALKKLEKRYIEVIRKKEQLFLAMAGTMSSHVVNEKLVEFNLKHGVERLQLSYSTRVTELEGIQLRVDTALQKLQALSSTSPAGLEMGVKTELDAVDAEKTRLADVTIPDSGELGKGVGALDEAVDKEIEHQKVTLDTLNQVMSLSSFIGNTTTSGLFGETTRKTIVPVDKALEAYHADKGRPTLLHLQEEIQTYLSHSSSQRVPYVLLLQSQVEAALDVSD